jgi:hypothetical protein
MIIVIVKMSQASGSRLSEQSQGQGFNRPNNGKMKVTCTKGLELNNTCDLHKEKKKVCN